MTQTALGELVGKDQPAVSKWERGEIRPSLEDIAAVEEAAGRPKGFVLITAGLVELPTTPVMAIELDSALSDEAKQAVIAVYEAMVGRRPRQ